jgi:isoquinoline 1-oxidoreductase subunit beta
MTTLTRRDFLKTGALASAGLVIAFHLPEVLGQADAAGVLEPNAWLRVDPNGDITVLINRSEMGQGVRTSLPMLVAEELEADWTRVRFEQAVPAKKYGNMSTGGSMSIRLGWASLRKAGAQAREVLVQAAADTWGVPRKDCRAVKGEVIHASSGRKLAYGALVAKAATLPVPEDPPLKDSKDFSIVGTPKHRLDLVEKNVGRATFGLDASVPNMLFAVVERCPVFGGKLRSFDPKGALAIKGVRHVVAIESGVAIAADSFWAAQKGRAALKVEWDEGRLAGLDSAAITKAYKELVQQPGSTARKEGDGAAALTRAARTIEATYEVPYLAHATMEPLNCLATVTADRCEVWVGNQNGTNAQRTAERVSGLPTEKVRVNLLYLGGGFGRRSEQDFVAEAVELSKQIGRPVKVVWTREDDMRHDYYRPATYNVLRAGFDAAGKPIAWTHRMVGPAIMMRFAPQAVRNGIDPTSVEGAANLPYGFPNLEVDAQVHDPGVPIGWWRSVGSSQNGYVTECFFDEVAAAAKRDPFELRRELLANEPRHRAVLERCAREFGWGKPLAQGRGKGIAVQEAFGSYVAQAAEVSMSKDGPRVHRVVCVVDCGQVVNPDTVAAQMESGIVYGLSAALYGAITLDKGRVVQGNFDDYPVVRMSACPEIEVHLAPSGDPVGGVGEPGTAPIAPAVVNAIFALTGKPVRSLPIRL